MRFLWCELVYLCIVLGRLYLSGTGPAERTGQDREQLASYIYKYRTKTAIPFIFSSLVYLS